MFESTDRAVNALAVCQGQNHRTTGRVHRLSQSNAKIKEEERGGGGSPNKKSEANKYLKEVLSGL